MPDTSKPGYGKLGDLSALIRESQFDGSKLPDWLRNQLVLTQVGTGGDDGGQRSQWMWKGEHPEGTFADENGNPIIQIGNPDDWQKTVDRDYVKDPSKAKYRDDIGWYTTPDNIQQTTTNMSTANKLMVAAIMAMFGGVVLGPALAGGEAGGLGPAGAEGFDGGMTLPGGETGGGLGTGTGTGAVIPGTEPIPLIPEPTPLPDPTPFPEPGVTPPPPTPTPTPTTPPDYVPGGPGTQPPAPVTNGATPQPGTGLINNIRNGPVGGAWDWYNNLSPASRMVVNQGISTGANALIGASRQRDAQQFATEQEQRQRADAIRRGQVPAFTPGSFTPKAPAAPSTGIINGVRSGG